MPTYAKELLASSKYWVIESTIGIIKRSEEQIKLHQGFRV